MKLFPVMSLLLSSAFALQACGIENKPSSSATRALGDIANTDGPLAQPGVQDSRGMIVRSTSAGIAESNAPAAGNVRLTNQAGDVVSTDAFEQGAMLPDAQLAKTDASALGSIVSTHASRSPWYYSYNWSSYSWYFEPAYTYSWVTPAYVYYYYPVYYAPCFYCSSPF